MSSRGHCSDVGGFNRQLCIWTANNKRINKHLVSKDQLLTMKAVPADCNQYRILVNLDLFDDYYYNKFINPDLEKYCRELVNALLKTIHFVLSDPDPYVIHYEFKCRGQHIVKHAMYSFGGVVY